MYNEPERQAMYERWVRQLEADKDDPGELKSATEPTRMVPDSSTDRTSTGDFTQARPGSSQRHPVRSKNKKLPDERRKRKLKCLDTPMDTDSSMGTRMSEETRQKVPRRDGSCESNGARSTLERPISRASGDADSGDLNLLTVSVEKVVLSYYFN